MSYQFALENLVSLTLFTGLHGPLMTNLRIPSTEWISSNDFMRTFPFRTMEKLKNTN